MKFLFSLLLLALAGTIFFYVGMPIFDGNGRPLIAPYFLAGYNRQIGQGDGLGIRALAAEKARLTEGLQITKELGAIREELTKRVNSISADDQARLDRFLPDSIDNVQLVLDVNSIADKSGLKIKAIKIDRPADNPDGNLPLMDTASSTEPQIATLAMGFTVEGSYESFNNFLDNLSRSLRLIDVQTITFQTPADGQNFYKYDVVVQTYWLK